jgi:hypothetical protein
MVVSFAVHSFDGIGAAACSFHPYQTLTQFPVLIASARWDAFIRYCRLLMPSWRNKRLIFLFNLHPA